MSVCITCGGWSPLCSECRFNAQIPWASHLGIVEAIRIAGGVGTWPATYDDAVAHSVQLLAPLIADRDHRLALAHVAAMEIDVRRPGREAAAR